MARTTGEATGIKVWISDVDGALVRLMPMTTTRRDARVLRLTSLHAPRRSGPPTTARTTGEATVIEVWISVVDGLALLLNLAARSWTMTSTLTKAAVIRAGIGGIGALSRQGAVLCRPTSLTMRL